MDKNNLPKYDEFILERLNSGKLKNNPPFGRVVYTIWGIITTPILFIKFFSEIDKYIGSLQGMSCGSCFGFFDELFLELVDFDLYDILGIRVWPADNINILYGGWGFDLLGFFLVCSVIGLVYKSAIKNRGYTITNYFLNLYFFNILGLAWLIYRYPKIDSNYINNLQQKAAKIKEQEAKAAERQKKQNEEAKKRKEETKKRKEEEKIKRAKEREKREQEKKNRLLAFKKKYGADATKALAGKIWVNMSFKLYREAQVLRPRGRKFGKKFENVVNGEERHTYRFDPYENRQGKISYNYEITTKDGLISGWKNLETN